MVNRYLTHLPFEKVLLQHYPILPPAVTRQMFSSQQFADIGGWPVQAGGYLVYCQLNSPRPVVQWQTPYISNAEQNDGVEIGYKMSRLSPVLDQSGQR